MRGISDKQKLIVIGLVAGLAASTTAFILIRRAVYRGQLKKQVMGLTSVNLSDVFNENRWKSQMPTISDPQARNIAQNIKSSQGVLWDDRNKVIGYMTLLNNKGDSSLVAHQYKSLYSQSLLENIEKMFSSNESDMIALLSILVKLK
jgi:hypothetical protein